MGSFSIAALASVAYNLDYPHFALIGSVWLVVAADLLEGALRSTAERSDSAFPCAQLCSDGKIPWTQMM